MSLPASPYFWLHSTAGGATADAAEVANGATPRTEAKKPINNNANNNVPDKNFPPNVLNSPKNIKTDIA